MGKRDESQSCIKEVERRLYPETIRAVMARIEAEKVPAESSPAEGGR